MIIQPNKNIIKPSYKNFNEAIANVDATYEHGVDMFMDMTLTNKKGKIEGTKTMECHSFLSNFTKMMCCCFRGGVSQEGIKDIVGVSWPIATHRTNLSTSNKPFYAPGVSYNGVIPYWNGPVIGVGTAAVTADDYKLEKWLTHGTAAEDLTGVTGTVTNLNMPEDTTNHYIRDSSKTWTDGQWNRYLLDITSGTANGSRFAIYYTDTSEYIYVSRDASQPYLVQVDDRIQVGDAYHIFTYGQVNYGDTAYTEPTPVGGSGSTIKLSISRDFTNGQGSSITIHEFGFMCCFPNKYLSGAWSYNTIGTPTLIIRDVDSTGVEVQDGEKLTLTYRIITVC